MSFTPVAIQSQEPRLLLGLRSTHLGGFVIINPTHTDALALRNISLHIVVPTVGDLNLLGITCREVLCLYSSQWKHSASQAICSWHAHIWLRQHQMMSLSALHDTHIQ